MGIDYGKAQANLAGQFPDQFPKAAAAPATGSTGGTGKQVYAGGENPAEAVYRGQGAPAPKPVSAPPAAAGGAPSPASLQGRLAQGEAMFRQHAPDIYGEVQQVGQRIRDGLSSANLGQLGTQISARVDAALDRIGGGPVAHPDPTFHPNPNPGGGAGSTPGTPPAARVARLTARRTAIDTAGAAYAAGSGSAMDKARAAAFVSSKDARLGARIAGTTPPPRPTGGFGPKTPGTFPIRDVRTAAGLPTRPRPANR